VACLGLSYKADIDDLRESPAVDIVALLADEKIVSCLVVESHVDRLPPELENLDNVSLVSLDEALERAGVVALLVDHREFKALDRKRLSGKKIVDTRGAWRG
jgi:UDP-N-acetyl-D-mannosaminuronic acid dehydrogenase